MTDYIKREDAIEAACMGCNDDFSNEPCEPSDCDITRKIMELPSADVVEVVRCKDCKYNHCELVAGEECWLCGLGHEGHKIDRQDFYCADGERREA